MVRKLLICVDRTPASARCIDWALDHVWREGDMVHLLHVVPVGQKVMPLGLLNASDTLEVAGQLAVEEDPEQQAKIDAEAKEYLTTHFAPLLASKKVPYQIEIVRCAQDNDSIGAVLVQRANELAAVAVVVARHNKGMLKEFFMGSVSTYMSKHCKRPVVVIHAD